MREINATLKKYLYDTILTQYENYDKGHRTDHILDVIKNSLEIAEDYDVDINMVLTIATYHDIGIRHGRKDHHITSAKIMREDKVLQSYFDEKQIKTMSEAIEDHRASNDYEPRTIYGKIVSEADRLIDAEKVIYRTIEYGKAHFPDLTDEQQLERMYEHIEEKYGEQGYLKLWLSTRRNEEGLQNLRALIKNKAKMEFLYYSILENEK